MAYLPAETSETIWNLLKQLLKIVEDASAAEFALFERYGETESTLSNLEDLKNVANEAALGIHNSLTFGSASLRLNQMFLVIC